MALPSCFWTLLSAPSMTFLYIPSSLGHREAMKDTGINIESLVAGQSIFDLVHPDEYAIAKHDLSIFLRRNTLAGAITRCRLRSFGSLASIKHPSLSNSIAATWDVVDVITYVVAEDTVLAFFHRPDQKPPMPCGETSFTTTDLEAIQERLTTRTYPLSKRVFQIYESKDQSLVFSWPPSTISMQTFKDTREPFQYNPVSSSCMRHTQSHAKLGNDLVESLNIAYGSLIFCLFEVDQSPPPLYARASSEPLSQTVPPTPMTQHGSSALATLPMDPSFYYRRPSQKQCTRCGAMESPEWRRGPSGHKTLCNACGLRYFRLKRRQ
ncbi:hypothetical protein DM01DRAFT_1408088 [Hesseltinella vesiculosa]|uniref:GATA-type domain-containing protein n=1 Tax=Hesseltinella vesiculosa TaxID=101127 RepID=A0A1X2GFR8_9FUNG|nr:hypothetical protein DM01DRAFT_1408088 [Hesseltinella vesiculosa]